MQGVCAEYLYDKGMSQLFHDERDNFENHNNNDKCVSYLTNPLSDQFQNLNNDFEPNQKKSPLIGTKIAIQLSTSASLQAFCFQFQVDTDFVSNFRLIQKISFPISD